MVARVLAKSSNNIMGLVAFTLQKYEERRVQANSLCKNKHLSHTLGITWTVLMIQR
jgi:hypothetical protein